MIARVQAMRVRGHTVTCVLLFPVFYISLSPSLGRLLTLRALFRFRALEQAWAEATFVSAFTHSGRADTRYTAI